MYDFERNFSLGRRYFPGIYFKYFVPFFTHFLQFSYEMGENYLLVVILSKKKKSVAQNNMRMNMFFVLF